MKAKIKTMQDLAAMNEDGGWEAIMTNLKNKIRSNARRSDK